MEFNPLQDLPMGFGMALVQNEPALKRFSAMDKTQQQIILDHTHQIQSKSEMQDFVNSIGM